MTHQITFGGSNQQRVTFEVTNGIEIMKRLHSDYKNSGAKILARDDYGFSATINGHNITYTMIEI